MLTNSSSVAVPSPTLWESCLEIIQEKIGTSSFETWFRTTEFVFEENGIGTVFVPNRFFADFIEEHFSRVITSALQDMGVPVTNLRFQTMEKDWEVVETIEDSLERRNTPPSFSKSPQVSHPFHPNYTFDKFVVGDSNRMAHAACLSVAEAPGKTTFNPLVIYGGTGLGKTHLLQAIGNFAVMEGTADNVVYLTSEEFTTQYISYVVDKKDSTSFYKKFRNADLLCIDDIQFFSGKPGTQKEFFRIFNRLLMEKKQIILSSDRAPDKIKDMMAHIISRFMGGLVTDIQPPNLETRMAILRKKSEIDGFHLPNEVVQYIAHHATSNIRELEGILVKLIASSSFTGRDITLDVAMEMCGDILLSRKEPLGTRHIIERVAEHFNVSPHQLSAHTRRRDVTLPRSVAMYLCKKLTRQSLRTIGLDFGGRDYSTVLHACRKIEEKLLNDAELNFAVIELEDELQNPQ